VSLDTAPAEVRTGLEVEACRPVWLVESVSRDAGSGRPLMCSRSWMRSDAVRVVVELGSPAGERRQHENRDEVRTDDPTRT
jgi:DNA-binding GntR family transcriptional regulator